MASIIVVVRYWSVAGLLTAGTFCLGLGCGWLWAAHVDHVVPVRAIAPWIQILSGAFFLWCVLGFLGWGSPVVTIDGESDAEKLNNRLLKIINCIGMLLLFTSSFALLFLSP